MVVFPGAIETLRGWLNVVAGTLPPVYLSLLTLLLFSLLLAAYGVLVWKFYRLVAKKDFLTLNLTKYNQTDHPFFSKLLAVLFYFIEYIVLLPLVLSFAFSVLAIIILLLSNGVVISQIIIIAVAIVASIRILAYYQEDIARDFAKLLPLTMLAIFLTTPGFFSLNRLLLSFEEVSGLFSQILYFFMFMIALELVLRILDLVFRD